MSDGLRLATWHVDLSRKGPGLLVRELRAATLEITAVIDRLTMAQPDVVLLTDIDFDHGGVALTHFREALVERGLDLPHSFSARPNTGMPTGLDIDGDGRLGGPRDAQGYGWFSGQGGQAVLSRFPLSLKADLSGLLWRDVPSTLSRPEDPGHTVQKLSSSAHWAVQVDAPGGSITMLTLAATPPVFDGPEDRNGRRNHDEVLLWLHAAKGAVPDYRPNGDIVIVGNLNLDPERGDGLRHAVQQILNDGLFQDPLPGQATVNWSGPGDMRVSYILPSADLVVGEAGVTEPVEGVGPHRLVWVDLNFP